jgi:pimeloyl-ACP methyl ester carboxylesterase
VKLVAEANHFDAETQAETIFRHNQVAVHGTSIHVVEAGNPRDAPFLFLHGWPESWRAWQPVMALAAKQGRAIAIDLPGVGESIGAATDGSKRRLAEVVHELIVTMGLREVTLVGQDVGGMIVYAYRRMYEDIARAVIMDVVIPGIDPWDEVLRNPYIWHFALHTIPRLPEELTRGRQAVYFDFFYDALSAEPARITPEARAAYVAAYATDSALTAGFNWYRAFAADAEENRQGSDVGTETPLLYLRGEHEPGDINAYIRGFRETGITGIEQGIVRGAGHFAQEEAPNETWQLIANFAGIRGKVRSKSK